MRARFFSILATFGVLSALSVTPGKALGIRIINQDPEAYARANAFTATADNPSAIYYNPAGITQLPGGNLELGAYGVTFDSEVKSAANGKTYSTPDKLQGVGSLYTTYTLPQIPLSLGLAVYSPYGLGTEYQDNTPFRTIATKAKLLELTIQPVVAYKITKTFSLAAGMTINYGNADLRRGILVPGDEYRFVGDGFGYGFTIGALWQPTPQHSFGLAYRGASRLDLRGSSEVKSATPLLFPTSAERATTKLDLPQQIVGGYSFRPTPQWNLEVDLDWTDWSDLQALTLHKASGDLVDVFSWHSEFTIAFGVTRYFENGFSLSAGYYFCPSATPDANFQPSVPDANLNGFTVGCAYRWDRWKVSLAYGFAYGEEHTVIGSAPSATGQNADGHYKFTGQGFSLAVTYAF